MLRRYALLGATALGGCSMLQGTTAVQDVTNDAKLILNGLQSALGQVGSLVPSNVADTVTGAIQAAQRFLGAISGATTDAAKPLVQQLIGALQAGLPTLLSMALPGPLGIVVNAVLTLLPALAQEIGLLTAPQAVRTTMPMTAGQARAVLATE